MTATRRVEILAFPSVQLLDVTGPLQVFATANDIITDAGGVAPYDLHVLAREGGNVTASAGVVVGTEALTPTDPQVDTLIVSGGRGVDDAARDEAVVAWLRDRAGRARRVGSVCTGAMLLGAAGVLDGRRAVTHWSFCTELARRFPAARVETNPIFVRDGPVWTSAGVTAGIDLALALVEEDLGRATALAVARYLVVFLKRPGGQAQFSAALSSQLADDRFDTLNAWIRDHLADDLSMPVLAREAGMSERSLGRHYAEATGSTPAKAVERLRVEAARHLLSEGRMPIKRVSRRCGFRSEEAMRRSFLRILQVTPSDYRDRFGGDESASEA
jgi:transcriptional regulator GlxA family with amidase domain